MTFIDVLFIFGIAIVVELFMSLGKPTSSGFVICLIWAFIGYFFSELILK